MIESKLMIGNLIQDTHGRTLTVHEIKQSGVRCLYAGQQNTEHEGIRNSLFPYEDLQGIPLTGDVLSEWCGFHTIHLGGRSMMVPDKPYGTKSFTVTQNTDISGDYWCFIVTDFPRDMKIGTDYVFISRNLQFLHQLMNLFYSVCGRELEYMM